MLNMFTVVGRLFEEPTIKKLEDGKEVCDIKLVVNRMYKNEDGIYETDLVPITLWSGIASNTCQYCHKGDVVGVKGTIQIQDEKVFLVAEKLSFLASKKEEENGQQD